MMQYRSNINLVLSRISKALQSIEPGSDVYDKTMRLGTESVRGVMLTRIHEDGQAADGSAIGSYSKKPLYANPLVIPGQTFQPEGKTGKKVFDSTGKQHKDKYFDGGYAALREATGKRSDTVNLNFSGIMQNTLQTFPTATGYGLGWDSEEMLLRARALEKKYGKRIWFLSDSEKEGFITTIKEGLQNGLSGSNN